MNTRIRKKIRTIISHYEKMIGSRDPMKIAKFANIGIQICSLGEFSGFYRLIKHKKWFLVVLSHELGHAFLHSTKECAFIKNHTLLLTSKIEQEANLFAAELLIPDGTECTIVYPEELLKLKTGRNRPL